MGNTHILDQAIYEFPLIDTHEHIGAFPATGMQWNVWGYRMDTQVGFEPPHVNVFDVIFGTCFDLLLRKLGWVPRGKDTTALGDPRLEDMRESEGTSREADLMQELWYEIAPFAVRTQGTGLYIALDEGLRALHGAGIKELLDGAASIVDLNAKIRDAYGQGLYVWCRKAFDQGNIVCALKPVHAVFLDTVAEDPAAWKRERAVFAPLVRIDDFLGIHPDNLFEAWHAIALAVGVRLDSLSDAELLIERAFRLFDRTGVVGIKQAQAYFRPLDFHTVGMDQAAQAWREFHNGDESALIPVQDYLLFRVVEQARARGWAFQIHTALTRDVAGRRPEMLEELFQSFPDVKFVMIHCYPYISEAAWLAREYGNVYVDTSWLAMVSPGVLRRALDEWIGAVPFNKICVSGDGMAIEDVFGALQVTRKVLGQVLRDKVRVGIMDETLATTIAEAVLSGNAREIYPLD